MMPKRVTIDSFGPENEKLFRAAWMDTTMTLDEIGELLHISRDAVRVRARLLELPKKPHKPGRKKIYKNPFLERPAHPPTELPVASPTQWDDGWMLKPPTKEQLMGGSSHVRTNSYYRSPT